ncbi:LysR family transcriptional regulator [Paraburkholderia caribensis]|uniref:LysR family transcriptional regulator n=1 Tax=Paraburkholderia caribensis TaxID=75105 RepID=UPI0034D2BF3F
MDRLFAMKVFVRVVETSSFSRAAQALNLPAPTVSRLVQSLEAHLGARLLSRTTRSVKATDDGLSYYERCVQVLNEIEDMDASLGKARRAPAGHIRVSLPASVAKAVLIPSLPVFISSYPEIQMDIVTTDRPVDLVGEGFDCAIRVGNVINENVAVIRIGQVWNNICASPDYIERNGEPESLEDLRDHVGINYVSQISGRPVPWDLVTGGKSNYIQMKSTITVNDADACVACALAGLGLVSASWYSMRSYAQKGALKHVLRQYRVTPRPISLIYMPNRHLPRKIRVFIDWFSSTFKEQMPE